MTHLNESTASERERDWLKDQVGWEPGDSEELNTLWGLFLELREFAGPNGAAPLCDGTAGRE